MIKGNYIRRNKLKRDGREGKEHYKSSKKKHVERYYCI